MSKYPVSYSEYVPAYYQLEKYLETLRDVTPHQIIKDEINELLNKTREDLRANRTD